MLAGDLLQNLVVPADVNADRTVTPQDALIVINRLIADASAEMAAEGEAGGDLFFLDVTGDGHLTSQDALVVINYLLAEGGPPDPADLITEDDVRQLLKRGAAASASSDGIIAVVDRAGRILGVRVEADVLSAFVGDESGLVFAVDGAVAKARTAAFFANNAAPLTSRTIRFISQSTITQREVESNPSVVDVNSEVRGPGFVAPIGLGGHFPPGVSFTPLVDLFAIEHQSRDRQVDCGADGMKGTADDSVLDLRFNVAGADLTAGAELFFPESYGAQSQRLPCATGRGLATLPGGIPLYKNGLLVGGIGVFFPGHDGFATYEQGFVHTDDNGGVTQTNAARLNAPKVLEAEWIAFAAAGGSSAGAAAVGTLGGVPPVTGYNLPFGRIDLVGITLEIFGPNPTQAHPVTGVQRLLQVGAAVGMGDADSGENQLVDPGADGDPSTLLDNTSALPGHEVAEGWLVEPHDSPLGTLTADDVRQIIEQGVAEAELVRAAIRLLPNGRPGARTRMVFSVADTDGNVLGIFRMPDATIFSIDVAVAKARNTAYYADPSALVAADRVDDDEDGLADLAADVAMTNRTFRFLAAPRFPTGAEGVHSGPFSILRDNVLDSATGAIVGGINPATAENVGSPLPASFFMSADTSVQGFDSFNTSRNFRDPDNLQNQNGVVFFPGSMPLYKNGVLVGGLGVSGDGVDQDDVVTAAAMAGYEPPVEKRSDQFFVRSVRLPFLKFLRNPRG